MSNENKYAEQPFEQMPSGVDIAHFFAEETEWRNNGGDGIRLWRDGGDYCYLWVEAFVDHDLQKFFMLDVRTKIGTYESRDHLWVSFDIFDADSVECEWQNAPIKFGASGDEHLKRLYESLKWFSNLVVGYRERGE